MDQRAPMLDRLQAVFNEARTPCHCSTQEAHDQALPVLRFAEAVKRQAATEREHLHVAEMADPASADALRGATERLHQTLDALDEDAKAIVLHLNRITQGMRQRDRYLRDIEDQLSAKTPDPATTITAETIRGA